MGNIFFSPAPNKRSSVVGVLTEGSHGPGTISRPLESSLEPNGMKVGRAVMQMYPNGESILGCMCAFSLYFYDIYVLVNRESTLRSENATHADVGSSSADVSTTWRRCSLPLSSWRPTLHTSRKSNLAGRKREQMIFLYLSPWALLLNKISATTGFLSCFSPFFLFFLI